MGSKRKLVLSGQRTVDRYRLVKLGGNGLESKRPTEDKGSDRNKPILRNFSLGCPFIGLQFEHKPQAIRSTLAPEKYRTQVSLSVELIIHQPTHGFNPGPSHGRRVC